MDITLERILSLIPRKPDGKFQHGAIAAFARDLGFKDGHIVSDWIAGNTTSYNNYLYEIAYKYNVAVEWLRGETDIKENPALIRESGLSDREKVLIDLFRRLPEDRQVFVIQQLQGLSLLPTSRGGSE